MPEKTVDRFTNGQGGRVKYAKTTSIECVVCHKGVMKVLHEHRDQSKDAIHQTLECVNCHETYPRMVNSHGDVLHDPFSKLPVRE